MSKTLNFPREKRAPIVTSWTLWRHLIFPSTHPLFKRTLRMPAANLLVTSHMGWLAPLIGTLACCGMWSLLIGVRSAVPVSLLMVMLLASTVYVSLWTIDTSVTIAHEREQGTYDLLCLAPSGALGVHWAICAASLHRKETFVWIDLLRKIVAGVLLFTFVVIVITAASREKVVDLAVLMALLLDMVSLAVASYLDHVQATVLGSLVGMSVPLFTRSTAAARIWAVLAFVGLQLGVILATLASVALVAPALPAAISPLTFGLLAFFLIRESAVIVLWHSLAQSLSANPTRIDFELA